MLKSHKRPIKSFLSTIARLSLLFIAYNCYAQSPEHTHSGVFSTRSSTKSLALPKGDDVFHFIIYGDRTTGVPEGLKYLRQAVVDTNLLDPDLVMTVGDLVQGYNKTQQWLQQKDEYVAIMQSLHMPWYPVAGNHDVYWEKSDPDKPHGQHESNYETHFGPLWYSFKHKNAGFIVLYSDEGDRVTGEKGFNEGRLQQMSTDQLNFLRQALVECKDQDHVFVFLHHPRWIGGGYTGSNWDEVHKLLVEAGNVSAVFAGHIHHMRYDGAKDGIEYFTLAATGGNLEADFPEAGYLHHFNVVTVRKETISVSTLPVGAVVDPKQFTPEFVADLELAHASTRPIDVVQAFPIIGDSSGPQECGFQFSNKAMRPIELTVEMSELDEKWRVFPDHQHLYLANGETSLVKFKVWAPEEMNLDSINPPQVRVSGDYIADSARINLPKQEFHVPVRVPEAAFERLFGRSDVNYAATFDESQACLKVSNETLNLPDGAFTAEAWILQTDQRGGQSVIAKTQNSEFAIAVNQGHPHFDVRVRSEEAGDRYVFARSTEEIPLNTWVHLAGVFDEQTAQLFVNGKLIASEEAKGKRVQNELSMFLGADPDREDKPDRFFKGKIDEVRISQGIQYKTDFTPAKALDVGDTTLLKVSFDQQIGRYFVDGSERRLLIESVGEIELETME